MLAPINMTFHTVLEIPDAFLAMLRGNIRFVMLVTTVAGIGRKAVRVTGLAIAIAISMPKRESMGAIVGSRFPGTRGMAGRTVCTELTGVFLRLGVTVYTRIHCRDAIMIKGGILPRGGVVAGLAIRPIPAIVMIVPRMTGITILRRRPKIGYRTRIEVAFCTGDVLRMSAFEFEGKGIMVEIFKTVHAVVASQTLPAKRKNMSLGEGNVHIAVAGLARV